MLSAKKLIWLRSCVKIGWWNLNVGDSLPAHSHSSIQEGFLEKEGLQATCKYQKDEPRVHSGG